MARSQVVEVVRLKFYLFNSSVGLGHFSYAGLSSMVSLRFYLLSLTVKLRLTTKYYNILLKISFIRNSSIINCGFSRISKAVSRQVSQSVIRYLDLV